MPWNNRFDVKLLLESIAGYKGQPFPGAWVTRATKPTGIVDGKGYQLPQNLSIVGELNGESCFESKEQATDKQKYANNGALLRRYDMMGNYYFMPVSFITDVGKEVEIDCALVSIQLKKTIVETPLVGRRGTVKELINCQDLKISVTGCLISETRGLWPEDRINDIKALFDLDDSVSIKCALTDCFFSEEDKVVITDLSFPSPGQVEDVVPLTIECVSDQEFELNL